MVGRLALVGLIGLASTVGAQTPPPTAANLCRQQGQAEQNRLLQADRAAGRAPDATTIVAAAKKVTRDCAAQIDASKLSVRENSELASLYIYTGDTAKAESIIGELLTAKGTEADRADAIIAGIRLAIAKWDAFAGPNPQGEKLVKQLDGMSDAVIAQKINGHSLLLGRYDYADLDDPIRAQATQVLALSKRALEINAFPMLPGYPAQGKRPPIPPVNGAIPSMIGAYSGLARVQGDYLHADSALMILDEADRVIGTAYWPAHESFEASRRMYKLVGTPASTIEGKWWVNAPDNTSIKPGNGKITVLQFTAHWCVPCKKSYPPMLRLMSTFKDKPVESIMVTSLYGYIGSQRNLTPEQEVAADREYFAHEHNMPFPVAITPAGDAGQAAPYDNEMRYAVGGIPQIMIIDRKGVIRSTVVGWDKGNEARFAAFIDKLLAER
jgi:thiol-disulfide isomerase/thioredoxin